MLPVFKLKQYNIFQSFSKSRRSVYWTKITNFTSQFKKEIIDILVFGTRFYSFACDQRQHQYMTVELGACNIESNKKQNHTGNNVIEEYKLIYVKF